MTMEEALKAIYEEYGEFYTTIRISFDEDGKGAAIYTDGIFNCSIEWD